MTGMTFVDCMLTYCLRWESCRGNYTVKGPNLLGTDEQGNKHFECKNYVGAECNKLGCTGKPTRAMEKDMTEQKTLF